MSARLICMNDYYAFDPDISVSWEEFEDVLGETYAYTFRLWTIANRFIKERRNV